MGLTVKKEALRNERGLINSVDGKPVRYSRSQLKRIVGNFNKKKRKVFVPYDHSAMQRDNTGFVKKLSYDEKRNSIVAEMDILKPDAVEDIHLGLLDDVSVSMILEDDAEDDEDLTLYHVAWTPSPALRNQKPLEIIDEFGEGKVQIVELSKQLPITIIKEEVISMENDKKVEIDVEVKTVDDEEKETKEEVKVNLEEFKQEAVGFLDKIKAVFGTDSKVKALKEDKDTLSVELESKDAVIAELEDTVKVQAEAVSKADEVVTSLQEEVRLIKWKAITEGPIGREHNLSPDEIKGLTVDFPDPEKLKKHLERRSPSIDLSKTIYNDDESNKIVISLEERLANVPNPSQARNVIIDRGWDKPGKEQYLEGYISDLSKKVGDK